MDRIDEMLYALRGQQPSVGNEIEFADAVMLNIPPRNNERRLPLVALLQSRMRVAISVAAAMLAGLFVALDYSGGESQEINNYECYTANYITDFTGIEECNDTREMYIFYGEKRGAKSLMEIKRKIYENL